MVEVKASPTKMYRVHNSMYFGCSVIETFGVKYYASGNHIKDTLFSGNIYSVKRYLVTSYYTLWLYFRISVKTTVGERDKYLSGLCL